VPRWNRSRVSATAWPSRSQTRGSRWTGLASLKQKLLPLTTQLAQLRSDVDKTQGAIQEQRQDDAAIAAQEKRLAELMDRTRTVAGDVETRVRQVQDLTAELTKGAALKDDLTEELVRMQGRQRDVTAQVQTSEDQMRRVEQQLQQLDQRRAQLAFADKKLAAFEGRLGELSTMSNDVDRKIHAVEARQAFVGAVKEEIDEVQQISARSKADLQHIVDHRSDIDALRARVDVALSGIADTEERIGLIEARRKVIDDVERKTNIIVNVLEDVRVNLEMVSEQKAVIDHVVENVATLDETLRAAQATQKSLRIERELAERIERGIKSLRSRFGTPASASEEDTRSA